MLQFPFGRHSQRAVCALKFIYRIVCGFVYARFAFKWKIIIMKREKT